MALDKCSLSAVVLHIRVFEALQVGNKGCAEDEPSLWQTQQPRIPCGGISLPSPAELSSPCGALLHFQPASRTGRSELPCANILFLVWRLEELKMHRLDPRKQTLRFPCLCIQDTGPRPPRQYALVQAARGLRSVRLSAFLGSLLTPWYSEPQCGEPHQGGALQQKG